MHRISVTALVAAALIALPAFSAGAQSATRHSTSTGREHRTTREKATAKKAATSRAERASMAGAWRTVYSDPDVVLSLDTVQTKRLPDGTFNTRLKWQYATDKPIGRNEAYRTLVEHRLMNCTLVGSKPVSAQTYNVAGKPVSSFTSSARDLRYMDWGVRRGGTSSSKAYVALCGRLKS